LGGSAPVGFYQSSRVAPPSIQLLAILGQILDDTYPEIQAENVYFSPDCLADPPRSVAAIIQVLVLADLSMHEGVFVPSLRKVSYKESTVEIHWEGGSKDVFEVGVFDQRFFRFLTYIQRKFWRKKIHETVSLSLVNDLVRILIGHTQGLSIINDRIQYLLTQNAELKKVLNRDCPLEFVFILISALPVSQLNHLFLHIYNYFPEDLVVKMSNGNLVDVCALFQSPTQDTQFLLEKAKVYLKLLMSPDLPVIRIITQTKTVLYLENALQNDKVLEETRLNLFGIRDQQILTRMRLYLLLTEVFGRLLKV